MAAERDGFEIGVDIGGTFTDVVCRDRDGGVRLTKIPTTRSNPSAGVRAAMTLMERDWSIPAAAIARFVHGTTVATNAVLEAKGAKIGLIMTEGFKDVLEIGRQMRHAMYDLVLQPEAATFLAPGALRKEVRERVTATGEVLVPLDEASVARAVRELAAEGVGAIAVSLLFSFLNPAHEKRVREITRRNRGVSMKCRMEELSAFLRGWRAYFGFCQTPEVFDSLDSWVRRRLRAVQWKQWRRPQRRCTELLKGGVSWVTAVCTAASSRGPWHLARSQAVQVALPNAHFDSLGLFRLSMTLDSTRRTAGCGIRMSGGVAGVRG